jgi:serine/threonine-protein kinase
MGNYMVMEYLDGGDLSAWLEKRGPLPVELAVEFLLQACEAIAEAHALGIVHRDLKPANLFVVRLPSGGQCVKVLDFGISKRTGLSASGASMTRTSAVMGSPLYMSPEQMQASKDADARSDIWALGVILYELVTGESPFLADSMPELVLKIMSGAPEPIRNKRPDAPAGLEQVVLRCLEKDRARRYATVGELAVALVEFGPPRARLSVERISFVMQAAGLSSSALDLPPLSEGPSAPRTSGTVASWGQTAGVGPRGKGALLAAALVVALGLGLGGVLLRSGTPKPEGSAGGPSAAPQTAAASAPLQGVAQTIVLAPPTAPDPKGLEAPASAAKAAEPVAPATGSAEPRPTSAKAPVAAAKAHPVAPALAAPPSTPTPARAASQPAKSNVYDDRK